MDIPKIQQAGSLKGKRVLVRLGLNVPIKNHHVRDDFRIRQSLKTIEYLKKKKAKIIIISHIGRGGDDSLRPVANHLNRKLNIKSGYISDLMSEEVDGVIDSMLEGGVLVLGNLRKYEGEVENSTAFAKKLASFGDIYVNDAFAVAHRKHASVVGIPKYLPSYAGLLFQEEVKQLSKILSPKHPFLFVIGGAKMKTKMPLMRKYAEVADTVLVGGALANDVYHARGIEVGKSLVDMEVKGLARIAKRENVLVPEDVIIVSEKKAGTSVMLDQLTKESVIVDAGNKSRKSFIELVDRHKLVVFNGPLGNYEAGYDKATKKLLKIISDSDIKSIVGGGDTVALVSKMKLEDAFTFVSTGGGAMLDFIVDGKLPAITALQKCKK